MSELDKTKGQPGNTDPTGGNNQPSENKTYTVNGKEMTPEQVIESYNNLQSEFTKKSQRLSEYEKGNSGQDDELSKTKEILKEMGFATTEELEDFKKFKSEILTKEEQAKENQAFEDFASQFNTLTESQKTVLKDLKKVHTDKDYSDILKMTDFIDQSLLEKSKVGQVKGGDNIGLPTPKEVPTIDPKIAKRMNLKSKSELEDIRSKFNI